MSTIYGKPYSTPRNINLKDGIVRFGKTYSSNPVSTDTVGTQLYVNSSKQLCYWDGSSSSILGTAGSVANFSLDDAYNDGAAIAVDGAAVTLTGTHASNNTFAVTGSGTGNLIDLTNTGSGYDIDGTSSTWYVTAAGAAVFTAITGCDALTAAANLDLEATGTGTITIGGTSSGAIGIGAGGGAVTITNSLTITGSADATKLTVTAGDVTISNGILSLDSDDTTQGGNLVIPSSAATTSNCISITADDLTTGAAIYIDSDNGASFASQGGYLHFIDGTNPVFHVGRYGATTIAGNAEGTDSLTLTAGDLRLTDGALIITAGAFTYTAGDMTMSDGSLAITDADDAASFSVTNNTATSASVVAFAGSGVFTGSTTSSWMTITPSGLTSGTGVYAIGAGLTTGKLLDLATDATMTTGTILNVQCTGANDAITSGKAASFDLTATAITGSVNKIGSGVSMTSSRTTTTGTVADDWDLCSIIRTDIINGAGSMSATGSVLYVENAVTNTSGTVTDTANGIEVVMDTLGTGDGVKITHAATGGKALNIVGAATSVSDVLITTSGVKANTKASLEVTGNGATAAGGAMLRVASTGTPAAATSYLAVFTNAGATCSSNPVAVYINGKDSTAASLQVTGSGAMAGGLVELNSTATGALGAVLKLDQTANSAAASDVVGRVLFTGQDDANAAEEYGKIDCVIRDTAAANPDASLVFYADKAGTDTQLLALGWDTVNAATLNGALVGSGAAAAIISSQGAYDLTIETNGGTSSGVITITDGANGDITITPNGNGQVQMTAPSYGQVTAGADGAASLTVAMCGLYTIGNTVARTLTLPAVSGTAGLWYTIKKTSADAAAVTIDTPGAETIDGAASNAEIDAQYDTITLVSDGSNWHIVYKMIAA